MLSSCSSRCCTTTSGMNTGPFWRSSRRSWTRAHLSLCSMKCHSALRRGWEGTRPSDERTRHRGRWSRSKGIARAMGISSHAQAVPLLTAPGRDSIGNHEAQQERQSMLDQVHKRVGFSPSIGVTTVFRLNRQPRARGAAGGLQRTDRCHR